MLKRYASYIFAKILCMLGPLMLAAPLLSAHATAGTDFSSLVLSFR